MTASSLDRPTADDVPAESATERVAPAAPEARGNDRAWRLAYLLLALAAVVLTFVFIRATLDDSFITWRYGRSLVEAGAWNWNPGGPLVEAYTNPLFAVLSIIPALLGVPVELFFKLVGIATVIGFALVVRKARLPRAQEFTLLAIALFSPVFYLQAFLGLETATFALFIAWLFGILYRRGNLGVLGFVVAALLAVSRPEGIAFAGAAIVWALVLNRRDRGTWVGAVLVLGGWFAYWCVRWAYFGQFFPNTYYKKSSSHVPFLQKALDLGIGLAPLLVPVLVGLAVCGAWYRRAAATRTATTRTDLLRDAVPLLLAVLSTLVVLGVYRQSNLVMDPGNRFYWQLLLPVALVVLARPLTGPTAAGAVEDGAETQRRNLALLAVALGAVTVLVWNFSAVTSAIIVGCGLVFVAVAIGFSRRTHVALLAASVGLATVVGFGQSDDLLGLLSYRYRLEGAHQAIGQAIASTDLSDGKIVVGDAGVLPYSVKQEVIDISGLGTVEAARGTLDAAFLDRNNVKMVVLISKAPDPDSARAVDASPIAHDWVKSKGSEFVFGRGPMFAPNYYMNYWIARDWADAGLLTKLDAVYEASLRDDAPDAQILRKHLFDFPFLRGD
ncbi:hypothetical protein V5P93_005239 [Actinokineospora auranticolor]|uniref:4-amino-4-deoxy-L-arabinose transferase-like glycosyltransferase n=1 Tax=Actinokineospora auranticolor TaxID=155976 RepID=A0A2S6GCX1_9PSEU|nr:hypothetical protein [Actinokineospora auranticolor]PPK63095.1 hypothetical protein CLV40_13228 [Actinokineospora auranticolor]